MKDNFLNITSKIIEKYRSVKVNEKRFLHLTFPRIFSSSQWEAVCLSSPLLKPTKVLSKIFPFLKTL